MQFDFFKRLLFRTEKPARRASEPRAVVEKIVAAPEEDPLLVQARALLLAADSPALAARLQLRWNSKMRSTAGMAYPQRSLITLNPRLRAFDGESERTMRHELAHLLAHERAGRRRIAPHGEEWRKACRDLGLVDEKRTHSLPLPQRKVAKKYHYRCPVCAAQLGRVKPLRRGSACLRCCRKLNHGRYDERFRFIKCDPPAEPPTPKI